MTLIPLLSRVGVVVGHAMVDDEDYVALSAYTWRRSGDGYARRGEWSDGSCRSILMHRVVMRAPDGLEVDHINWNRLDNRRSNLRLVTDDQQVQNRPSQRTSRGRPRTSKFRGVCWDASRKRWRAQVMVGGAMVYSRFFATEYEAAAAASAARAKYMTHAVETQELSA